jgi:uncharacterized protein
MTTSTMGSLRELQRLDRQIRDTTRAIQDFDPQLAEVEDPALRLEGELEQLRRRVEQMREDERRLHRSSEEKRERSRKLEERLNQVSNLREEAAVKAEADMLRRALDADEKDQIQLAEQLRRAELQKEELAGQAGEARASVEPRQADLLARREALRNRADELRLRRDAVLELLGPGERRVYQSFHASGRLVVVATLTEDGACGNCFNVVPLQLQNEIRRGGEGIIRCEACGVILTAEPEPEPEPEPEDELLAEGPGGDGEAAAEPDGETEGEEAGEGGTA